MKSIKINPNILKLSLLLIFSRFLVGCQQVVDIELPNSNPKLVVEASILWQKGTSGSIQKIKLSTTSNYYTNVVPPVSGATIIVKNSSNSTFNFIENPGTGEYICNNFVPVINETYTLNLTVNGKTYRATETLKSVAPIINLVQDQNAGTNGDRYRVRAFYIDPANEENFYLYKYIYPRKAKPDYYVGDDRYTNGNQDLSISLDPDLRLNDQISISHEGISKQYYNYMTVLLGITGDGGAGAFSSPPATVRGNIINTTNPDDFPFGYFRLSEVDSRNYTIQ